MKPIQTFVSTAICAATLAFAATASAQTVTQGIATVVRIEGSARYSSSGGGWLPLTAGKTLGANDVIQTAADSTVDLVLSDKATRIGLQSGIGSPIGGAISIAGLPVTPLHFGSGQASPEQNIIRLQADTMLSIDKFTYSQTGADTVSDTELNLTKGKIFGNVKKISAASEFIVKMPTGVAGIRGTAVIFDAEGGATVLQGSAVISEIVNGTPTTITLTAGQSYDPGTQQVVTLNAAAELAAIEAATSIIVTVNAAVTVAYPTPTASGSDTPVVYVSPTSGKRTIVATAGNTPPTTVE